VIYLIEELIMPGTECIEDSLDIDIINQHAAICAPVERYAKALEPLLPCRVPYLHQRRATHCDDSCPGSFPLISGAACRNPSSHKRRITCKVTKLIFNEHLLGEEISSDRRLVLLAKLLVHISNRSLSSKPKYFKARTP